MADGDAEPAVELRFLRGARDSGHPGHPRRPPPTSPTQLGARSHPFSSALSFSTSTASSSSSLSDELYSGCARFMAAARGRPPSGRRAARGRRTRGRRAPGARPAPRPAPVSPMAFPRLASYPPRAGRRRPGRAAQRTPAAARRPPPPRAASASPIGRRRDALGQWPPPGSARHRPSGRPWESGGDGRRVRVRCGAVGGPRCRPLRPLRVPLLTVSLPAARRVRASLPWACVAGEALHVSSILPLFPPPFWKLREGRAVLQALRVTVRIQARKESLAGEALLRVSACSRTPARVPCTSLPPVC